jgi:hypothetical protein
MVKGFGEVDLPDGMSQEQMRLALRQMYPTSARQSATDALTPIQTADTYEPTLSEMISSGIGNTLYDTGIVSDRYRAMDTGRTLGSIAEAAPVIGDAIGGDDLGRAIREGDAFETGVGLLSAIPVVGDAAGKGARKAKGLLDEIDGSNISRLFHGSDAEFNEFDPARVGDKLTSLGLGHYLTPKESIAKQYGKNIMQFDVDTSSFLDWGNLTKEQRKLIEKELVQSVPQSRISHFGEQKIKILKRDKEGLREFRELQEKTKDAYNDYSKARLLDDDDIMAIDESLFDKLSIDDEVVGWREGGDLSSANNQQLMTLMNEYRPELASELGFKGSIFGDQVAVYDSSIPKRVNSIVENGANSQPIESLFDDFGGPYKAKVYHQTDKDFDDFDFNKTSDGTVWFTDNPSNFSDPSSSSSAAAGKGRIIERDIELNKVAGYDELDKYSVGELIDQGYDGAVLDGDIQVFNPSAIKSNKTDSLFDSIDTSYRMQHTAPYRDEDNYNSSLDDVTNMFGDDIYTGNAVRYFGVGSDYDQEAVNIIQKMAGDPDGMVTIYRAVPEGVDDINPRDWVTTTKQYALDHIGGDEGYKVISKKVKAKDVFTDGNSIHEFGYDPTDK